MKIKCIYCLEDKTPSEYIKREHIIPQLLGTFTPDNLILNQIVCDECNEYFGNKLELYLGRDTYEGIVRYQYGIRSRKIPKKYRRIKLRLLEGRLKGIIVILGENGVEPVMQVGFFNKDKQEYEYFEPQDIADANELREKNYDLKKKKIFLIAEINEQAEYLSNILKEKGIAIRLEGEMDLPYKKSGELLVEVDATIDRTISRGICKIAFNYLTYVAGHAFVLTDDFNVIRDFIRYDKGSSRNFFIPNVKPILYDDRRLNIKSTEGHLIYVAWDGMSMISRVSIFNELTYLIKLCQNFKGLWRPIKSGHHFDVKSKKVNRLIPISSHLML